MKRNKTWQEEWDETFGRLFSDARTEIKIEKDIYVGNMKVVGMHLKYFIQKHIDKAREEAYKEREEYEKA